MTRVLVGKLLRDVWVGLVAVCLLLFLFELLWARVTFTISFRVLQDPSLRAARGIFESFMFQGPGEIIKTLMGVNVDVAKAIDMLSIGYVHPVVQIILCIWALGRSSSALAGEVDRGTMELLLAQPVPRSRLIVAHLLIDVMTIPLLCLSMWLGSLTGLTAMEMLDQSDPELIIEPLRIVPGLANHALLVFALSGLTMLFSALGRFRARVLGIAVMVALMMFLVNVLAQLWTDIELARPLTVFFYFDPQLIILKDDWTANPVVWVNLGVLLALGTAGYALALWFFSRRDLPAPL